MSYPNIRAHLALPQVKAPTRKQLFDILSAEVSRETGCPRNLLFDSLMMREKSSSSGIGGGVAIPHLKMRSLRERFVVIATLETPVDFDAPDSRPVDLVCLFLSPESDGPVHLRGLSRITRLLQDEAFCDKLRETQDSALISALITNPEGWLLAA